MAGSLKTDEKERLMQTNCASPHVKSRHTHLDFWYYKLLTAVPLFTVLVGFWKTQPFMILIYLLWIATHISLVYRFLCSHCPHYGAYDGKTQCLYLWGVPPVYKARPGAQSGFEKAMVMALLGVSILFPTFWLFKNPELLVIYLLSIGVLLSTMMRYECTRCVHETCPHCMTPGDLGGSAGESEEQDEQS